MVDADQIMVLENGKIAEQGSHFELLADPKSLYSDLWKKQNQVALENSKNETHEPLETGHDNHIEMISK